jgi:hypothetical protein
VRWLSNDDDVDDDVDNDAFLMNQYFDDDVDDEDGDG